MARAGGGRGRCLLPEQPCARGLQPGSEPRASLGPWLRRRCHRELPAFPLRSKAELDRHKFSLVGWTCTIFLASKEKHLMQTLSIPRDVLGLCPLVLGMGSLCFTCLPPVLMPYTGSRSVTHRVLASSDCEARQPRLNNLPGSRLLWQRRTSLNLKAKNKSRSQRCRNLLSPGNARPAWPRAELLNLAPRIKHSSIPTPTGFVSRCIQHRDGCAGPREGGCT